MHENRERHDGENINIDKITNYFIILLISLDTVIFDHGSNDY